MLRAEFIIRRGEREEPLRLIARRFALELLLAESHMDPPKLHRHYETVHLPSPRGKEEERDRDREKEKEKGEGFPTCTLLSHAEIGNGHAKSRSNCRVSRVIGIFMALNR